APRQRTARGRLLLRVVRLSLTLQPLSPVPRPPLLVCDSDDMDDLSLEKIHERVRKSGEDVPTCTCDVLRPAIRRAQHDGDRVIEFAENPGFRRLTPLPIPTPRLLGLFGCFFEEMTSSVTDQTDEAERELPTRG